jgi:hypothetical protein
VHLRGVLEALGLQSFVKVSGSKGLHLSVPLNGEATYEQTQPFAKAMAELVAQQMPDRVVSEMAKSLPSRQGAHRLEPELRLQDHGRRVCHARETRRAIHLDADHLGGAGAGDQARRREAALLHPAPR